LLNDDVHEEREVDLFHSFTLERGFVQTRKLLGTNVVKTPVKLTGELKCKDFREVRRLIVIIISMEFSS